MEADCLLTVAGACDTCSRGLPRHVGGGARTLHTCPLAFPSLSTRRGAGDCTVRRRGGRCVSCTHPVALLYRLMHVVGRIDAGHGLLVLL